MRANQKKSSNAKAKMRKSCRSKKKYPSEGAAWRRARQLRQDPGINLKPYLCSICKGFHLAKINPKASLEMAFEKIEKERKKAAG